MLSHLKKLVIKPIYRQPNARPLFGTELSSAELDTLHAQINAQPHLYVGQEYIPISTTPSLIEGKLEPRRAILRSFLFAEKEGYAVMSGGLTRCEGEAGELTVTIQDGGVRETLVISAPENGTRIAYTLPLL